MKFFSTDELCILHIIIIVLIFVGIFIYSYIHAEREERRELARRWNENVKNPFCLLDEKHFKK